MLHKLPGVNSVIFFWDGFGSPLKMATVEHRVEPVFAFNPVLFLIFFWFPNNQFSQPQMVSGGWHHADPDVSSSSNPCQLPRTFASTSLLISTTTSTTIKVIPSPLVTPCTVLARRTLLCIHHIPVNSIQGFLNLTLSLSWVDQWSVTHPHFPLIIICPLPFLLTYLILSSRVETLSSLCQWWGDTKQVGDKSKLLF